MIEVLANGNLVVRGEKVDDTEHGRRVYPPKGTIRPDDIDFENTIASNRVSNARIQYSGTGVQKDTCRAWILGTIL
ncbi:flagellar basal body L-ring protein FlgH [Vibrio lentus]|nr:flagellar basal body L-ring protein FlgH [Vibrio lentus]